jgi:hypothetical protein
MERPGGERESCMLAAGEEPGGGLTSTKNYLFNDKILARKNKDVP